MKFKLQNKKLIYIITGLIILPLFLVISLSSLFNIYEKRSKILSKLGYEHNDHNEKRFLINPLKQSDRQTPPTDIKDLKINNNSEIIGQWSAPIDWNVTAIHSVLLPDETVMTFGTFGIDKKESDKDIRSNKKITITDGREIERDGGSHQWSGHDVNSGIDFDIWDPKKGVGKYNVLIIKGRSVTRCPRPCFYN